MAEIYAETLGISPDEVLTASTGIIGKEMPMCIIEEGIKKNSSTIKKR